jgi:hypothetical protein
VAVLDDSQFYVLVDGILKEELYEQYLLGFVHILKINACVRDLVYVYLLEAGLVYHEELYIRGCYGL